MSSSLFINIVLKYNSIIFSSLCSRVIDLKILDQIN